MALLAAGLLVACAPPGLPEGAATASPSALQTPQTGVLSPSLLPTLPAEQPPYPEPPGQTGGRVANFPQPILVYRHEGRAPGSPCQWTIYLTGLIIADDGSQR